MKLNILHFVDNAQVSTLEVEGTVKSSIASISSNQPLVLAAPTDKKHARVQWVRDGVAKDYRIAAVLKRKSDERHAPFCYDVQLG